MKEKRIIIITFIVVIILIIGVFAATGLFQKAIELNNTDDMKLGQKYEIDIHIEEDTVFDKREYVSSEGHIEHYFALPCSITIDGEKYYTYVYLIDGAYTNFKEDNKYSWNNKKGNIKLLTTEDKNARSGLEDWCKEKNIKEKYILQYGFH